MTPVLILALAVGAPGLKDPPKKDVPGPIGRWALQGGSVVGMPIPQMDLTVTFRADGRYESKTGGGETKPSDTFTADPKKEPTELDLADPAATDGKVSPSIYRIEGNTLTICTAIGKERPTSLDGKAANTMLLVLRRIQD